MSLTTEIEKKKELIREAVEDTENLLVEKILKEAGPPISMAANNTIVSKSIDDALYHFVLKTFTKLNYQFDPKAFVHYWPDFFEKTYNMRVVILKKSLNLDKIKIENIYNKMWPDNEIAKSYDDDFVFNIKDFKYEYILWNKMLILTSGIIKN